MEEKTKQRLNFMEENQLLHNANIKFNEGGGGAGG